MTSPSLQYRLQGFSVRARGLQETAWSLGWCHQEKVSPDRSPLLLIFFPSFLFHLFFFLILISAHERKENHVALADAIKTLKNRPLFSSALTPSPSLSFTSPTAVFSPPSSSPYLTPVSSTPTHFSFISHCHQL